MKRSEFRRTANDELVSQLEDEAVNDNLDEIMQKASADYYERRWKYRANDHKADWCIAVGLYLILAGVAFVVV